MVSQTYILAVVLFLETDFASQVLGLLVEVTGKGFQTHLSKVLPVMRSILQSAVNALTSSQQDLSDDAVIPFWKEAYYSLVMFEKILSQFQNMFLDRELEVQLTILSYWCSFLI